jgi:hypothetical protein
MYPGASKAGKASVRFPPWLLRYLSAATPSLAAAYRRAPEPEGRLDPPSEQVWREGGSQVIRRSNEDEAG